MISNPLMIKLLLRHYVCFLQFSYLFVLQNKLLLRFKTQILAKIVYISNEKFFTRFFWLSSMLLLLLKLHFCTWTLKIFKKLANHPSHFGKGQAPWISFSFQQIRRLFSSVLRNFIYSLLATATNLIQMMNSRCRLFVRW